MDCSDDPLCTVVIHDVMKVSSDPTYKKNSSKEFVFSIL